jgi:hypothetical protein
VDDFLMLLLLKMAVVFFCVCWINTFLIHYCYLKFEGTSFTKQTVKSAYTSSLVCTMLAIFIVRVYQIMP